jgi:hypothetical protein
MASTSTSIELRGAIFIDKMQPQFAATCATNSDGFFPVAGESSFWLEVRPGIVINRLMDVALKACDVKPGALITERSYGTLEVHGPDQGMVRQAGALILPRHQARRASKRARGSEFARFSRKDHRDVINKFARACSCWETTRCTRSREPRDLRRAGRERSRKGVAHSSRGAGSAGRRRTSALPAPTRNRRSGEAVDRALAGITGRPNQGVD